MKNEIATSTDIVAYTGGTDGGCFDVATIKFHGCTLVSNEELARLRAGRQAPAPQLKLNQRDISALSKVIEAYWDSLEHRVGDPSKEERNVWAASAALNKIRAHQKEIKK